MQHGHPGIEIDTRLGVLTAVSVDIVEVSPAIPVEHTPISVTFSLTNNLKRPVSGTVQLSEATAFSRITNLAPRAVFNGTVQGRAPAAGPDVLLEIDFFDDEDLSSGEFPPPTASGTFRLAVSATYDLGIDSLMCKFRCSQIQPDSVIGGVLANVGDKPLGDPTDPTNTTGKQVNLGDVPTLQPIPLGIKFAAFTSLAGSSPPLDLAYTFTSQGGWDIVREILDVVSSAARGVLTIVYPQGSDAWKEIDQEVKKLHDQIYASCGRPVVVDHVGIPSDQLLALTSTTGVYSQQKEYIVPATQAYPCQTSDYFITFTITRTSFRP